MTQSHVARTLTVVFLLVASAGPLLHAQSQEAASSKTSSPAIEYRNTKYGFCVSLPASWQGYSIVIDHWEGANANGRQGYQIVTDGPLILIRHPLWTKENPRQDVPIMVFTRKQWNSMQKDEFHIGAAPIGPSELARTHKYVFAVPARYDFTELTGVEEVRRIVQGNSLQAPCK